MNKRRRDLLAALTPAATFAREQRPDVSRETTPGLAVKANATGGVELYIYGPIGGSYFDSGIGAVDVINALQQAGNGPIDVRLNSPGGDVFQGVAIHTALARHPGTVTVYVDGHAASAASFIMLAGDRIVMAKSALVMIHDGMTGVYGAQATLDRASALLGKVSGVMAEMYADRAGEDVEHWRGLMTVNGEDGTWFTSAEAFENGLVDEIVEPADESEETQVWDRLAAWRDNLPTAIQAAIDANLAEIAQPVDEPVEDIEIPDVPEDEGTDKDIDPDEDFAHTMAMWAWMNKSGHLAGKDKAHA